MLSRTACCIFTALVALVLACTVASSFRVEPFESEPAPDVVNADKLDAERLPREDDDDDDEDVATHRAGRDRMANRVPEPKIPVEEEEAGGGGGGGGPKKPTAGAAAPPPPPPPPRDDDAAAPPPPPPTPPPPASAEGGTIEPFVGGMMARF